MTWDAASTMALARTAVGTIFAGRMRSAERGGVATACGWDPKPPGRALVSC